MSSIPLAKTAEIDEFIKDLIWDSSAGPMENILKWVNRYIIIRGGGPGSLGLTALTALGYGLPDLGEYLDKKFGFSHIDQVLQANPDSLTDSVMGLLDKSDEGDFSSPLGKAGGLSGYLAKEANLNILFAELSKTALPKFKFNMPKTTPAPHKINLGKQPAGFGKVKNPTVAPSFWQRRQMAKEDRENQKLRELEQKARKRELTERARGYGRGGGFYGSMGYGRPYGETGRGSGLGGLKLGLGGLFGWIYSLLANKTSWLSMALRGAGVVGAEHISGHTNRSEHTSGTSAQTEHRSAYKEKLTNAVENILGE